jgi:hypothetical protein
MYVLTSQHHMFDMQGYKQLTDAYVLALAHRRKDGRRTSCRTRVDWSVRQPLTTMRSAKRAVGHN